MTKEHLFPVWEDLFLGLTLAGILASGGRYFHIQTVAVMVLILSLGLREGLTAGTLRAAVVTGFLFVWGRWRNQSHPAFWTDILPMMGCGLFSGVLGDRQRKSQEALKQHFAHTLQALAQTLDAKDPYTEGHSRRTAAYAVAIAKEMGLEKKALTILEQAGLLHDFGKIGTPDAILGKQGSLTPEEQRRMHEHPVVGSRILEGIPSLEAAAEIVRHHHEKFDGTGYPSGLAGEAIPLATRILSVADALDSLTTNRPYRKAVGWLDALHELERESGRQFDPAVLNALKRVGCCVG